MEKSLTVLYAWNDVRSLDDPLKGCNLRSNLPRGLRLLLSIFLLSFENDCSLPFLADSRCYRVLVKTELRSHGISVEDTTNSSDVWAHAKWFYCQ